MRSLTGWMLLFAMLAFAGCGDSKAPEQANDPERSWDAETPVAAAPKSDTSSEYLSSGQSLQVGERFPLRKRVEQELLQDSLSGPAQQVVSNLDVRFVFTVEDRVDSRTKLRVDYDRILFSQRVGDDAVDFDSDQPPEELTPTLQAFLNMSQSGFTCWLDEDLRFISVEQFDQFVESVLQGIPEEFHADVVLEVETASGDAGLADFIGEAIGQLPQNPRYRAGDQWERSYTLTRPIPMHSLNVYTLKRIDSGVAFVDIRGKVTPSTTPVAVDEETGVRITVTGGETVGSSEIDTDNGLPRRSETLQKIDMVVTLEGALQFNQRKSIRTRVEAFREMNDTHPPVQIGESNPLRDVNPKVSAHPLSTIAE
ncbi:hypothetical protein KOR42_16160 [Thalassoglobus neptunius]|uniref:Uncharacterized protein n=2 Tax=Thalassoglobus neptunius TaxID=1938619 RepID=A0A5C5X7Z2_9PLAN|nr:hypothetical protein KOR42_16160 [Thalassoglobus neptunius]